MKKKSKSLARHHSLLKQSFSWITGFCLLASLTTANPASAASNFESNSSLEQNQQKLIQGKVTDKNGDALPGVNIIIKGTATGTTTNIDGNYQLNAPTNSTLIFTFIGYLSQEVAIANQTSVNVILQEDVQGLEEVVVVGYGTQKKVNLTGSVSSVKNEDLVNKPMADTRQALQGAVTGLSIVDRGGVPGEENLNITIRGIGSIPDPNNASKIEPLVLVDGIEMSLNEINANDIETVSVLKDAASSAIYGARAANGVILITTKRGKASNFTVNYNGYYGWQTPATLPELVGAEDYLNLVNEARTNAGLDPKYSEEYIQKTVSGEDPINYPYTNLFKELIHTAPMQNHSIRVSGGNETARVSLSLNYLDQDGLLKNMNNKKYGFRLNTDLQLKKNLKIRGDISFSRKDVEKPHRWKDAMGDAVGSSPVIVPKYPNGLYGLNKDNKSALAKIEVGGMNNTEYQTVNLKVGADWEIVRGLKAIGDLSYKSTDDRYKKYSAAFDFLDPINPDPENPVNSWSKSKLTDKRWNSREMVAKAMLSYDKTFSEIHNLKVLAGSEQIENKAYLLEGSRQDLYSNDFTELNTGDIKEMKNRGYMEDWALRSFFGRLNYNYNQKYLLEANFRYDGSSRFAEGYKWGFFPSFSLGWRVSEESFLQSIETINNLKFRGSWGQLGNQNIGYYRFTSTIYADYPYSFNDNKVNGYSQWYYANTNVTWETTEMLDLGFDLSLFDSKIEIIADYFIKDTKDVLLTLPISHLVGLDPSESNAGKVRNQGWELSVTHRNTIGDFNYSLGFNISDVKNELVDFAENEPSISDGKILKEGEAIWAFYGFKSDGLFQSQQEIDNHPTQQNHDQLKPGDIKFVDLNNDGVVDDDDRTVIGSNIPRYTFGINLSCAYKGFDLSAFLQGVMKVDNYFYGSPNEGPNYEIFTTKRVLDRWTPENPNASFPRLEANSNKNNDYTNDFWIRDASYLRLKNLQVGYTFPNEMMEKLNISKLRVYVGATNLFTITDVESGLDPETYSGRPKYYPPVSTYTLGVNLNF
ncbi:MAG: SusC/RagA family TonB-linked outer membrane protein [Marinifilaceae bacterium]